MHWAKGILLLGALDCSHSDSTMVLNLFKLQHKPKFPPASLLSFILWFLISPSWHLRDTTMYIELPSSHCSLTITISQGDKL